MVDESVLARKIAAVHDAVARIHEVLPPTVEAFLADRGARESVVLNLFVALQECLAIAVHWLADEGRRVPDTHREVLAALVDEGVVDPELGQRLAAAAGLRNLVAHQYGVLDWTRIHAIASSELGDLEAFCAEVARAARAS